MNSVASKVMTPFKIRQARKRAALAAIEKGIDLATAKLIISAYEGCDPDMIKFDTKTIS